MKLTNLKEKGQLIGNPNDLETYNRYLREISKFKPLSRDEEVETFKKYKETGDSRFKDKICKHNLLFVVSVAKRYAAVIPFSTLTLEDLINEGNIGLCLAVDRFDQESGNKFISYAVWWIRQQITKSIQDNFKTIKLPPNVKTLIRKIEKKEAELEQILSRDVTTEDIFHAFINDELGLITTSHKIDELLKVNRYEISLNKRVKEDEEFEIIETLKSDTNTPYEDFETKERLKILHDMMNKLPDYVKNYLTDFFGLNEQPQLTLKEMAQKYERSSTGIKQTIDKYMRRMRANNKSVGRHLFPTPDYVGNRQWKEINKDHENTIYLR